MKKPQGTYQTIRRGLEIGSSKNNMRISHDGEVTYSGKGTTWDDIQTSLTGRRLSSNAGRVDYNYEENAIEFQDDGDITNVNDCVSWSIQYPHKAVTDGVFRVHVHWEQEDATSREWTLWYRLQPIGTAKGTTWTEVVIDTNTNNIIPYTSGVLNQITSLVNIDMTDAGLSCIVQFRLTRSDSEGGVILGQFVDAHYAIDSTGSSEEFIK